MKIAVCVNREGATSSLTEKGTVRVYDKSGDFWTVTEELVCEIDFDKGLACVRSELAGLIKRLDSCRVFVASEVHGQLYYLLEAGGFNSYEAEGEPEAYLDSVLEREAAEEARKLKQQEDASASFPVASGKEGAYTFNLKKALAVNPETSSKKLLRPFLKKKEFKVLEVICDHIPRWFDTELEAMGLHLFVTKLAENEYKISIKTELRH